jgi:hypothetical protein
VRLPAVLLLLLIAPALASAEPVTLRRERVVSLEMRAGLQAQNGFPAVGAYVFVPLPARFSVGVGYELVRVFDVALPSSCDTRISPAVAAGLRGGVWHTLPLRRGFFFRGGLLLGVASPRLGPARLPLAGEGTLFEAAADLTAGWAHRYFRVALFVTPGFSVGTLSTPSDPGCPAASTDESVAAFSVHMGLAIAVQL